MGTWPKVSQNWLLWHRNPSSAPRWPLREQQAPQEDTTLLLGSLSPAEVHPDKRRASHCTTPTLRNRRFFPYISASLWGSSPHTIPPSSHTCCCSHHTLKLVPAPQFLADLQLPLIQRTQCKGYSGVSEPRPQKTQQLALPAARNPVPRS